MSSLAENLFNEYLDARRAGASTVVFILTEHDVREIKAGIPWVENDTQPDSVVTHNSLYGCPFYLAEKGVPFSVLPHAIHSPRAAERRLPLPRWCQPQPQNRQRFLLDSLPTTGNRSELDRADANRKKAKRKPADAL